MMSLYVYYKNDFNCEPIVMVCSVTNACTYIKVVGSNEFTEAACDYIGCEPHELEENEDHAAEYETINFNSKFFKDLIEWKTKKTSVIGS